MSALTAIIFTLLGGYVALMFAGQVPTDFALFLFVCTVISGAYFAADRFYFGKRRALAGASTLAQFDARQRGLGAADVGAVAQERAVLVDQLAQRPWWVEYTSGFFPVILMVFVLRSFLFEPFRIPSGSMIPTLQIGDLILVNKYAYGIRLPIINKKIVSIGDPQRGDVIVFKYPHDTSQDYIKRLVGLPGDRVEYSNRQLTVNGVPVPMRPLERYSDEKQARYFTQFSEQLGNVDHRVIFNEGASLDIRRGLRHTHPTACSWSQGGVACTVPPGHYFMMGDNRDNSEDSRFWGFVPDDYVVGRAFFVWMNFGDLGRIGSFH